MCLRLPESIRAHRDFTTAMGIYGKHLGWVGEHGPTATVWTLIRLASDDGEELADAAGAEPGSGGVTLL